MHCDGIGAAVMILARANPCEGAAGHALLSVVKEGITCRSKRNEHPIMRRIPRGMVIGAFSDLPKGGRFLHIKRKSNAASLVARMRETK